MLEIIFRPFVRHRSIGERVPEKFRGASGIVPGKSESCFGEKGINYIVINVNYELILIIIN